MKEEPPLRPTTTNIQAEPVSEITWLEENIVPTGREESNLLAIKNDLTLQISGTAKEEKRTYLKELLKQIAQAYEQKFKRRKKVKEQLQIDELIKLSPQILDGEIKRLEQKKQNNVNGLQESDPLTADVRAQRLGQLRTAVNILQKQKS